MRQVAEDSEHREEHDAGRGHERRAGGAPTLARQGPVGAEPGEDSGDERHDKEGHPGSSRLLDQRHQCPPQLVEGRRPPEAHQQEQQPDAPEPQHQPAPVPRAGAQQRERHDGEPQVLRVQLERVRAPVRFTRTDEVLEEKLEDMIPRDRERHRAFEPAVSLRPGRERNVFEERHDLDRGDSESEQHRGEGEPEPAEARPMARARLAPPLVPECEIEREQPRRDQQVVRELEVAEQRQRHGRGEKGVPRPASLPQGEDQGETGER